MGKILAKNKVVGKLKTRDAYAILDGININKGTTGESLFPYKIKPIS